MEKTILYTIDERQITEINEMLLHLAEAYSRATGEDVQITFQKLGVGYGFMLNDESGAVVFDTAAKTYKGVLAQADDILSRKYIAMRDEDIPF